MQQSLQNIDSDWQEELETEVRAELTVSLAGKFSGLSINYISRLDTVTILQFDSLQSSVRFPTCILEEAT